MEPQEWERWERFCRTGRVTDYLNYRGLREYPEELSEGESADADGDQSGGALGQEHGGI